MILSITVGFDMSAGSRNAVDFAVMEAKAHDSLLRVVSCLEVPITAGDPCMTVEELAERRVAAAKGQFDLAKALLDETPALKLDLHLVDGSARKVLREESQHSDLVVVGREGVPRALPWLVGSTARSLSRHSHCPIAIVPSTWAATTPSRVVVGVEQGRQSTATLAFATGLAEANQATLVVIGETESDAVSFARSYHNGPLESLPAHGNVIGALIGAATPDDIIVLGTRHHGRFAASLFGADTDPIVERTIVPVVVVPEVNR